VPKSNSNPKVRRMRRVLATLGLGLLVSACTSTGPTPTAANNAKIRVVTSIYPLNFIATQVAGPDASVTSLVPPGADAHHSEISLRQLRHLAESDLLVYLSEFQPAVDQALATNPPGQTIDVADLIELQPYTDHDHDDHDHDHGHDHGVDDPHFWLDPANLATVTLEVGRQLAVLDQENAAGYEARASKLAAELTDLRAQFETGLAHCASSTLVVSHAAFGYLTEPLGLTQIGIAGLDPDSEPSLARIRQIRDVVSQYDVTTIFYESPTNPYVAQKVADSLGLKPTFLDPLEIQNHPDQDYLETMNENLTSLRTALECQ